MFAPCVEVTVVFVPATTSVFAAPIAVFKLLTAVSNWLTFTASVGATPAATFVILFPPLFNPAFVKLTVVPPDVIVIPLEPTFVISPVALV